MVRGSANDVFELLHKICRAAQAKRAAALLLQDNDLDISLGSMDTVSANCLRFLLRRTSFSKHSLLKEGMTSLEFPCSEISRSRWQLSALS